MYACVAVVCRATIPPPFPSPLTHDVLIPLLSHAPPPFIAGVTVSTPPQTFEGPTCVWLMGVSPCAFTGQSAGGSAAGCSAAGSAAAEVKEEADSSNKKRRA